MATGVNRRFVVSAVNLVEGGPLTALRDCLAAASNQLSPEWEIVALVHDHRLFDLPRIRWIEFPRAKRSWLRRLYLEFWRFHTLSRELDADVWLSLHDISPRVLAKRQAVYCHNPAPFYKASLREAVWEPKFFLFTRFYRYLYGLNIHANDWLIVQQDWIRQAFYKRYGVRNVVVARPVGIPVTSPEKTLSGSTTVFLYPALPRVFKNFEVLCEAVRIVERNTDIPFELRLTLSGDESRFAAHLHQRYGEMRSIRWIGHQSQADMAVQYAEASAVVFPSRLETWGLPITEAKAQGKTLFLADLPYAHETLGGYDKACFFDPTSPAALAALMQTYLNGSLVFQPQISSVVAPPLAESWEDLIRFLITDLPERICFPEQET